MQKTIWLLMGVLFLGMGLTSCDNELEVSADWKEIAVIYAALNPTDAKQYIRVQRAYLDEKRGALSFSHISDSLYFDSLEVTIDEIHNGSYSKSFTLNKVDGNTIGLTKDSGIFASDVNYLYELSSPIKASSFFDNYSYNLSVKNPRTGYLATSNTISVGNAEITSPINHNLILELQIPRDTNNVMVAKFQEGKFARTYDMVMSIHVLEVNKLDTTQTELKTLDWKLFGNLKTASLAGFAKATRVINTRAFYYTLQNGLEPNDKIYRRLIGFDLKLYGIADEFYTYINVNKPSIGIIQKKPEYTNISNGFGLFTSRYINAYRNLKFHSNTKTNVMLSIDTQNLGFVSY